jgi:hypothetical protein
LRKRFIYIAGVAAAAVALALAVSGSTPRYSAYDFPARQASPVVDPFLIDLQERTFHFFWDTANPRNGLVPDRFPVTSYSSVASVGFALTTYPIGVERAYVTREQARKRVLATLRFLHDAPQGAGRHGYAGYRGFFYHFLDMKTGARFEDSEISTVDTSILLAGVLFCQSYFDGPDAEETEIRRLADDIYRRVDWRWAQPHAPAISLGWSPEAGFLDYDWRGYNEAMLVYVLALGSPTQPVGADAWGAWTSTYDKSWGKEFGQELLAFPPLFGHQYPQIWLDVRSIQDDYMRRRGIDYFENSRRAVYAQQAYAIANPKSCKDYGATVWGITASDGPADIVFQDDGVWRSFRTYAARGIGSAGTRFFDDCTLAPTAVVASIPFAPELAIPAVLDMYKRFGDHIYSKYGFVDAFNLSFSFGGGVPHGSCIPGFGWVDSDYIGIDEGAILAMIENYRSGLIWRVMRTNPYVRKGLQRAGFSGGWLQTWSP